MIPKLSYGYIVMNRLYNMYITPDNIIKLF